MELIRPSRKYRMSYLEAANEYEENCVKTYHFMEEGSGDMFERFEELENGRNLPRGWVKGTYLWLVQDDEFWGEICIRHSLTDELRKFGGNIGYGVRFTKWNQGIGSYMLAQGLEYARRNLPLKRVLLTCNDDNMASARVIEKNGGILQDKIENVTNERKWITRRYWIEL